MDQILLGSTKTAHAVRAAIQLSRATVSSGLAEQPWRSGVPPAAFYRFSRDRKGEQPTEHLNDYSGWMHADGYSGFNELYQSGRVREIACMAHIRRNFVDVFKSQGLAIAEEAIKRIAALYHIEKEARGLSPEDRAAIRQTKAKPLLDELET